MGFVAHIPHYLAQMEYPQAAVVLLEQLEIGGRLTIDLTEVRAAAEITETEISHLPRVARRRGRRRARSRAAVRRLPRGRVGRARRCSPPTSRCRPVRRSGVSSSSSWPASTRATTTGRRADGRPLPSRARLQLLQLEDLDVDLFRGQQARRPHASACSAARWPPRPCGGRPRSVEDDLVMHSMHSYFLRPGDTAVPIIYDVERIRDGRSFVTRRVMARQHGRPIYYHDRQLPGARGRTRPPGPDARRAAARDGRLDGRPRAQARPRVGRGVGARVVGPGRRATSAPARWGCPTTPTTRPAPSCGCGSPATSATTRWSTWRPSPTPAT